VGQGGGIFFFWFSFRRVGAGIPYFYFLVFPFSSLSLQFSVIYVSCQILAVGARILSLYRKRVISCVVVLLAV